MDENPTQGNSLASVGANIGNSEPANNTSLANGMAGMLSNEPGAKPNGDKAKGSENNTLTNTTVNNKPAWTSQLTKEVSDNADVMKQLSKFTNISDLAKSYAELESKLGNSIVKPSKDAKTEDVNAFYEKLGRPKDKSGYSLKNADSEGLKDLAFGLNLTDEQFTGLYNGLNSIGKKMIESTQAKQAQLLASTDEALHKEYGDKYAEKIGFMQRGIQNYGGKELGNALSNAGILYHPAVVKLFITLGEQSAEAGSYSRGAGGGNTNYKTAAEGGYFHSKY